MLPQFRHRTARKYKAPLQMPAHHISSPALLSSHARLQAADRTLHYKSPKFLLSFQAGCRLTSRAWAVLYSQDGVSLSYSR
ncbi:MAG: hypothetical protein ACI8Z0_002861 [Lentimonas sp.]